MISVLDLPAPAAQEVLSHLDPWSRTQAVLSVKPWSRLGTLAAHRLRVVARQLETTPATLQQLAAAAPHAKQLLLVLDSSTAADVVAAIFQCMSHRAALSTLGIIDTTEPSQQLIAPSGPTAPSWGPHLPLLAASLTSLTLHASSVGQLDLSHLAACSHLTHLSIVGSVPSASCGGLDAPGVLAVAALKPLTSAKLQLDLKDLTKMSMGDLLERPEAAPLAEEVQAVLAESGQPVNAMWLALQVFGRRHGPTLQQLSLSTAGSPQNLLYWSGPLLMPQLTSCSYSWNIRLDLEEPPEGAGCSALTSLTLGQPLSQSDWDVLPGLAPQLQRLNAPAGIVYGGGNVESLAALAPLTSLTSLSLGVMDGQPLTRCLVLTQLRELELMASPPGEPGPSRLGEFSSLSRLTQLHLAAPTLEVDEGDWRLLAGQLPELQVLHVTANFQGEVPTLPGSQLVSLHLHNHPSCRVQTKLHVAALSASLTSLELLHINLVDALGQQIVAPAGKVPWAGQPLQLPGLERLLLSGSTAVTPVSAFSASPITYLELGCGSSWASAEPGHLADTLVAVCRGLPLLQQLSVCVKFGDGGAMCGLPLSWCSALTALRQLDTLELGQVWPPEAGLLLETLPQLQHLTQLTLWPVQPSYKQLPLPWEGLVEAVMGCSCLRVLELPGWDAVVAGTAGGMFIEQLQRWRQWAGQLHAALNNCMVVPWKGEP